jgi:hypothetical protein
VPLPLLEDVFKTSGVPTHTFVEPKVLPRLKIALRSPGRGVVVEGPSGIGKTTAVTRALEAISSADRAQILSARVPEHVELIELLPETASFGVVVVDDFHVLPVAVMGALADHLKVLADVEDAASKLVIVGINRAGDALVRHAPDLANRIDVVRFEVEPAERVAEVIRLGEEALNIKIEAAPQLASAAQGSFYLAQMLCQELCLSESIDERQDEPTRITAPYSSVKSYVMERQERRFGEVARQFARGPRFRPSGRAPYLLLLKWLAESQRWDITVRDEVARHPQHRGSVGQVVDKGYLATHAGTDEIAAIIHYEPEMRVLSVEDPHLVFYLRNLDWSEFARDCGFANLDLEHEYDFALSFAGEDRAIAKALYDQLDDDDYVVFYDENEMHRILGKNLEEFLGPIYATRCRFVIAVLGPKYGEKRWAVYESEQFEERFGEGRVIPIWNRDAGPSAFDETRDIGYLQFDPTADPRDEARRLAEIIKLKYADEISAAGPIQIQLDIASATPTLR